MPTLGAVSIAYMFFWTIVPGTFTISNTSVVNRTIESQSPPLSGTSQAFCWYAFRSKEPELSIILCTIVFGSSRLRKNSVAGRPRRRLDSKLSQVMIKVEVSVAHAFAFGHISKHGVRGEFALAIAEALEQKAESL